MSEFPPAGRGEIFAWAAYDIANATYGTVVATAIYNAYFVNTICGKTPGVGSGQGTVLLTLVICVSASVIVLTAPIIGTIADATASKKRILLVSTILCILFTFSLAFIPQNGVIWAMLALGTANVFFGTGEDLIASFLPELTTQEHMGRVSSIGWAAGYVGSLLALGLCGIYIGWAQGAGQQATTYVPNTMAMCAGLFTLFSIPTFLFLKERRKPDPVRGKNYVSLGFSRLAHTVRHARHYRDLFNFLLTLFVYSCGTTTVIHLASVYAQEALKFTAQDSVIMILVVCVTAAVGAVLFGNVQDRIGSIRTLGITLGIWTVAVVMASFATEKIHLWIAANLVGIAMGATGSAGRALVGQFSPRERSGEFLGLWGMAHKLATAVGAFTFGAVTYLTGHNYRIALLSCAVFFVVGLILLLRVNEQRGKMASSLDADIPV
ncbi:MAG: MFS transporter [Cyanobacteria bacterium]|nr:MFS transporter [Cyanobacteriota bacterium]